MYIDPLKMLENERKSKQNNIGQKLKYWETESHHSHFSKKKKSI